MEEFRKEIFEHLGCVFYAIAAEQRTPPIATGEVKMAIEKDWLVASSVGVTRRVSEAAHLIGIVIDTLQSKQVPATQAFSAFEKFYREHEEQFSDALKRQILETADTIMRVLPSLPKKNESYERLKHLLYTPADVEVS